MGSAAPGAAASRSQFHEHRRIGPVLFRHEPSAVDPLAVFQLAEIVVPRQQFATIPSPIDRW
jgi:hypothetical protein